jgi:hypothetical protein
MIVHKKQASTISVRTLEVRTHWRPVPANFSCGAKFLYLCTVVVAICLSLLQTAQAQQPTPIPTQVTNPPTGTSYFALYYDTNRVLKQVELLKDLAGRKLEGVGAAELPAIEPEFCSSPGSCNYWKTPTQLLPMDSSVEFVVYYGYPSFLTSMPPPVATPIALEYVKGKNRIVEALNIRASGTGGSACLPPKICLCGTIQACCRCVP